MLFPLRVSAPLRELLLDAGDYENLDYDNDNEAMGTP